MSRSSRFRSTSPSERACSVPISSLNRLRARSSGDASQIHLRRVWKHLRPDIPPHHYDISPFRGRALLRDHSPADPSDLRYRGYRGIDFRGTQTKGNVDTVNRHALASVAEADDHRIREPGELGLVVQRRGGVEARRW